MIDILDKRKVIEELIALPRERIPRRALLHIKYVVVHSIEEDMKKGNNLDELVRYDFETEGRRVFSYHFVMERKKEGNLFYRTLDYWILSRHLKFSNTYAVGIGIINGEGEVKMNDIKELAELVSYIMIELAMKPSARNFKFHRELKNEGFITEREKKVYLTSCPGWNWDYEEALASLIETHRLMMKGIQKALKKLGYYAGRMDGKLNSSFSESVKRYKKDMGLLKYRFLPYRSIRELLKIAGDI